MTPETEQQIVNAKVDFLDYYSCIWNTLTVVEPTSGVSLRFDNSELCRLHPDWCERENYLRGRLTIAVGRSNQK